MPGRTLPLLLIAPVICAQIDGVLVHTLWHGTSVGVVSAPAVAQEDLPLRVVGVTADGHVARVSLRNDAAKPIVAWTVRLMTTPAPADDGGHSSHDRVRALVLQRLNETVPYTASSTRPLQPNDVATLSLGAAGGTLQQPRVVAVVYADGSAEGDLEQLALIQRRRERIAAAIDRWLPVVETARAQPDHLQRSALLDALRSRETEGQGRMVNDDEYPDLIAQIISTGENAPSAVKPALDHLHKYLVSLRAEIRKGLRTTGG